MNKLKKFLVIFICLLFIGFLLEYGSYIQQSARLLNQGYTFIDNRKIPPYPTNLKTFKNYYFSKFNRNELFNNKTGMQYKKKPVIVFGDVFVNSISSEKNMTHIISETLKVPVYNLANAGWGIQHMYFLLKNEDKVKNINPETIIFVYNTDQINRLTSFSFYPHHYFLNLKYKNKNGSLIEETPLFPFIYNSYFIRNIERYFVCKYSSSKNLTIYKIKFDLIQKLFEESMNTAKIMYPSLQNFVVLRIHDNYDSLKQLKFYANDSSINEVEYKMWQNLINEGFKIVDISDFASEQEINSNRLPDSSLKYEFMQKFIPAFLEATNLKENVQPVKKETKTVYPKTEKSVVIVKAKNKNVSEQKQIIQTDVQDNSQNVVNTDKQENLIISEQQNEQIEIKKKNTFWSKLKTKFQKKDKKKKRFKNLFSRNHKKKKSTQNETEF